MKKKNEMIAWIIFILVLMGISICVIVYFRSPRLLKTYDKDGNLINTTTPKQNTIVVD